MKVWFCAFALLGLINQSAFAVCNAILLQPLRYPYMDSCETDAKIIRAFSSKKVGLWANCESEAQGFVLTSTFCVYDTKSFMGHEWCEADLAKVKYTSNSSASEANHAIHLIRSLSTQSFSINASVNHSGWTGHSSVKASIIGCQ